MDEILGKDNYSIFEVPTGDSIDSENFSEFQTAYDYLKKSNTYREELKKTENDIITSITEDKNIPLIITEGSTDWKHMKAAYSVLSSQEEHRDFLSEFSFDFFEYEPPSSNAESQHKIEMGDSALLSLCRETSKIPKDRKIIFIADRDKKDFIKQFSEVEKFKAWGNNVFSFVLPIPEHRRDTPDICIEHLYTDEIIKRELLCVDGEKRRLYLANEFNKNGYYISSGSLCCKNPKKCGKDKIHVLEGTSDERVINPSDDSENPKNYALPKSKFAEAILNQNDPFKDIDFAPFLEIFKTIDKIIKDKE